MKKLFTIGLLLVLGAAVSPLISTAQQKDDNASSKQNFECPQSMTKAQCKELLELRDKINDFTSKTGAKRNIVEYFAERRKETHLSPGKDLMEELAVLKRVQADYEKITKGRELPPLAQLNSSVLREKVRRRQLINNANSKRNKPYTAAQRQQVELIKIRRGMNEQQAKPISFEDTPMRDLISLYQHFDALQKDDRSTPERIKGYKRTQEAIRNELCKRDENVITGTRKEPGKKICK